MDQGEFYKRIAELFQFERLQPKRVAVIGLGSGGCRVAVELGRLGVELLLVERPGELLLEHNIIRHVLGYASLGKLKLAEMARFIRNLNPATRLTTCALDVVQHHGRFAAFIERKRPHLIAVCTDNEQSKHAVNAVAVRLAIPQVGGGVYDGGVGGEVYIARPEQACYGCVAAHLRLQSFTPQQTRTVDYNHLDLDELGSTCALNLDIEQIALIQSRFALQLLLDGSPDLLGLPPAVNLCIFANRVMSGPFTRPLYGEFFSVARRVDCLICGKTNELVEAEADRVLSSIPV